MIEAQKIDITTAPRHCGKPLLGAVPYSEVYLMDCVAGLRHYPDNYFDLAVVDPPYGINFDGQKECKKTNRIGHKFKGWDSETPNAEYWDQLFRVSKNQIVWGGNYMTDYLKQSRCWLIWDKEQEFSGSDFEMAWTSFNSAAKAFRMSRVEAYTNQEKIHPTQKPVRLYDWIFMKYAKQGDLILDTHVGSGSSRIAADKAGLNFVGFEIDEEYFNAANKRFDNFKSQTRLF